MKKYYVAIRTPDNKRQQYIKGFDSFEDAKKFADRRAKKTVSPKGYKMVVVNRLKKVC